MVVEADLPRDPVCASRLSVYKSGVVSVVVASSFFRAHGPGDRMRFEVVETTPDVFDERRAQIFANAMANENSLDHDVLAVGRQGIRRHLPAAAAEAVSEVIEGVPVGIETLLNLPRKRRNTALWVAAVNDLERPQFGDLVGDAARIVVTGSLDLPVTLLPKAEKIVVLADDLPPAGRNLTQRLACCRPGS